MRQRLFVLITVKGCILVPRDVNLLEQHGSHAFAVVRQPADSERRLP